MRALFLTMFSTTMCFTSSTFSMSSFTSVIKPRINIGTSSNAWGRKKTQESISSRNGREQSSIKRGLTTDKNNHDRSKAQTGTIGGTVTASFVDYVLNAVFYEVPPANMRASPTWLYVDKNNGFVFRSDIYPRLAQTSVASNVRS